jgi:hypothetical protein
VDLAIIVMDNSANIKKATAISMGGNVDYKFDNSFFLGFNGSYTSFLFGG